MEGLSATEIHTKMVKVLKESAPSFPTVHRIRVLVTSVEDEPRSGRPKSATEIIEQVFDIVCKDPSLTKREIADGISDERVLYKLHMKKLFGKLVPHSLTMQISQRNLKRFKQSASFYNYG